jgi:hypothetical protein
LAWARGACWLFVVAATVRGAGGAAGRLPAAAALLLQSLHTPAETTIFILVTISTHAPFAREVPGGVHLAMFGRDSLPVRETLASSHVAGAPPAHQH